MSSATAVQLFNGPQLNTGGRRAGDAVRRVADMLYIRGIRGWQGQHNDLRHVVETARRW